MSIVKIRGFNLGYNETGSGDSPLIFLHGVGSDKSVWAEQLSFFGQTRRTIAFDYPGYGCSDLPAKDLSREEIAVFLLDAMNALNVETAHICGLSMGGVIALEIYKQQPTRVRSLILADTFAKHPDGEAIVERSQSALATMTMREFAEKRVDVLLAPQTSTTVRQRVVETMARIDKRAYAWASVAVWQADYSMFVSQIAVPTLVICGELDQPTPPALSDELRNIISNAEFGIIKNAGHLSNLDQPHFFNQAINDFLRTSSA